RERYWASGSRIVRSSSTSRMCGAAPLLMRANTSQGRGFVKRPALSMSAGRSCSLLFRAGPVTAVHRLHLVHRQLAIVIGVRLTDMLAQVGGELRPRHCAVTIA